MPCRSDHMAPQNRERELSRVAYLLDELEGQPINPHHWNGYHPAVYNQRPDADALVSSLCAKLQGVDITRYSLEMQIWWRDHEEADRVRARAELHKARNDEERRAALAKLTPRERQLLGLDTVPEGR